MKVRTTISLFAVTLLAAVAFAYRQPQAASTEAAAKESILKAAEVGDKLLPDKVFFRGQVAPVEARNSAGVHYADGRFVLVGLVDSSGYSTGIREKYQAYFINEVPLEIGGQSLKPGAYGVGFVEGNRFVVMDIGANDVFQVSSAKDGDRKRPVPLEITGASGEGNYRLYHGRDYVEFHRAK